ncbi:hypothetical protein FQN49_007711 [Arthroderma sp. PD_2]|nr:hypothetical protein FQN49_007711 [Arthroderma sp. PD_2]
MNNQPPGGGPGGPGGRGQDYLDKGTREEMALIPESLEAIKTRSEKHKLTPLIYVYTALDAAEKKFGKGKIDPNKSRGMNEKITDFARNTFEKVTGKKVPKKFSN